MKNLAGLKAIKQKAQFWSLLCRGARGFEPPTSCTPCKRANRAAPSPYKTVESRKVLRKARGLNSAAVEV